MFVPQATEKSIIYGSFGLFIKFLLFSKAEPHFSLHHIDLDRFANPLK
jgi:hypothetical protein